MTWPKRTKFGYALCRICGYQPKDHLEEPTGLVRFWDCDDGWKIGALCRWCWDDYGDVRPKPADFAYQAHAEDVCTCEETDEDPTLALEW